MHTARTDRGHEFQAPFHWHLADHGIRHIYIKARTPQLNGKVERSHRTDKQEFYQLLNRELHPVRLGAVRTVAVRVRWCRPTSYYELAGWRGMMAMDGGCLTNQGIHHVALMRHFAGEVYRVP